MVAIVGYSPTGNAAYDEEIQRELGTMNNPPRGAVLRMAGPFAGGWRVVSVWESQEDFEAFKRDRLLPAFQKLGRPAPQFESWPLHNIRVANEAALRR